MTQIQTRLLEVLKEVRPEHDFAVSADFIADGLLDSFDIIALVTALDRYFHIAIDGMAIVPENFSSLLAIQNVVEHASKRP